MLRKNADEFSAADVVAYVQKEKNNRAIGFMFGAIAEQRMSNADLVKNLAAGLRAAGSREQLASRLIAIAGVAPEAPQIAAEVMKGIESSRSMVAARVFLTNAWVRDQAAEYRHSRQGKPLKLKKKQKKGATNSTAWDEKLIQQLLADPNPDVREMAVLGCAYLEFGGVEAVIETLKAENDAGLQAAKLLYRARMELAVSPEEVQAAFAVSPPVKPGCDRAGVGLSSFDARTSPWCVACEAVAVLGKVKHLPHLVKALQHPDLRVQIDAARAMEQLGTEDALDPLLARLPRAEWPVRVAIYSALGAIPSEKSVPALVAQFEKETGRCRLDAIYALASIAGDQMNFDRPAEWQDWWAKQEKSFKADRARTRAYRSKTSIGNMKINYNVFGYFYKLPIYAERFVFTPDTSNSMRGSKLASLKREFAECVRTLSPGGFWNIVNFGGDVDIMLEGKWLDVRQVNSARERIDKFNLTAGTRIYDALELALMLPGCEEIVLLTDGNPAGGTFAQWPRVHGAIALLNRYRMVAFDMMEYATKEGQAVSGGMQELADRNHGRAVHVIAEP